MNLEKLYDKNYKRLMLIPLALLALAIIGLTIHTITTGSPIDRDISLTGGIEVTINKEGLNFEEIKSSLENKFSDISVRELVDLTTRKSIGVNVRVSGVEEEQIKDVLKGEIKDLDFNDINQYTASMSSARFSEGFYKSLVIILMFAFLLMALVVLIAFRNFIPSIAVISTAFMDIVITLEIINLMGVKLSSAGIVAFLLVIGYSIDTDVLLTTRVLKRKIGTIYERMESAIKTGLTMTSTTVAAVTVAMIIASFISPELKQIFLIILIALIIDIITTYLFNGGILIWYCKKKNIT